MLSGFPQHFETQNQGESRRFSKVNFSKDKKDKIKDTVTGVLKE